MGLTQIIGLQAANFCARRESALNRQQKKLSTGMKINGAGDGAAEYSISEKMRVMIRSLDQDADNLQQGTNVSKAAEAGLDRIMEILTTIKEKAINSANDTNTNSDRAIMQKEIDELLDQIDDIAVTTNVNGVYPLREGGMFQAADGYSSGIGEVRVTNNGGYQIFDKAEPTRFLMSIDGTGFSTKVRVSDGVNSANVVLNDSTDFVKNVNMFIDADNSVTYRYNDGNISFEIRQSYEINEENGADTGYSSVNIIYEFKNTGGRDLKYDIAASIDPIGGQMNVPQINETVEASTTQKRYSAADIANGECETILCNPDAWPVICNATATLSGDKIYNQPDYITVGDANITSNWDYISGRVPIPNTGVNNYHYTPAWINKSVPAGSTYKVNTIMGVKYPIEEGKKDDFSTKMWIQSGTKSNDGLYVPFCNAGTENLGIKGMDLRTRKNASQLLSSKTKTGPIDLAIERVSVFNSRFGAYQKRMEYSFANVTTQHENIQSAESVIRDANMAKEMTGFTRDSILMQSAQAMLAQANTSAADVMKLLQ